MPHKVGVTERGEPQYDKLVLNYDLDRAGGGLVVNSLDPVQTVQASAADAPATLGADWNSARLCVEYPHPGGDPSLAKLTLRLSPHSHSPEECPLGDGSPAGQFAEVRRRWMSLKTGDRIELEGGGSARAELCADDEIWVLDLPKQELDLLLFDLADSGFFDEQMRPSGAARLNVTIDRGETAKTWTTEPRLDELVYRVYRNGRLEGFISNGDPQIEAAGWSI